MFPPLPSTFSQVFTFGLAVTLATQKAGYAQLVDWSDAIASAAAQSQFTTVEATTDTGSGQPGLLVAGHFTDDLNFGPAPMLTNTAGQDGVVAFLEPAGSGNWDVTWKLQAESTPGTITINDLFVESTGTFFICGTYSGDADFGTYSLNSAGVTEGFVAWGDPDPLNPMWLGAFAVPDLLPESLAVGGDPTTSIYLTGPGSFPGDLAQSYDTSGNKNWNSPAALPQNDTNPTDIVLSEGPNGSVVYVLAEDPSGSSSEGLAFYQLETADGTSNWEKRLGSSGTNSGGGLGVTPSGDVFLAFSSNDPAVSFDSNSISSLPSLTGTHALLLRINENGDLVWDSPLGRMANANGSMLTSDLAVDEVGNAFVSAVQSGPFEIENNIEGANQDAVILGVDGTGLLFEYQRSTGNSAEAARAVSSPSRDLLVTVGDYIGSSSQFGNLSLPNTSANQGFVAIASGVDGQELFILQPTPPLTVTALQQQIEGSNVNGQVYHEIFQNGAPFALSAYLTDDQLGILLGNLPPGSVNVEPDVELTLQGTTSSSDWALGHLNDAASAAPTYSYTYPDTTETVYVYLIDTAVGSDDVTIAADLATFFGGNTNLSLEPTTLIRGSGDPIVSSVFEHGSQMASLIAGPETGSGVGVPLVVKNFDFYPNGTTTTAGLLADAVDAAMVWHETNAECSPGVIVIASGSQAMTSSATITSYLKRARDDYHLASIISAGNEGGNTGSYTPSENGSEPGIICTAGSTESEGVLGISNTGVDVDLYAPGDGVRVVDFSAPTGGGYDTSTGTSASAALTCGVATIHLSLNPWLSPEDLESEVIADTASVGTGPIDVLEVATTGPEFTGDYDMWAEFHFLVDDAHGDDDDGDGWTNLEEYFYGLDPCSDDALVDPLTISYDGSAGDYTLSFSLNAVLVDESAPATLRDGSTIEITDSADAILFTGPGGTPSIGSTADGRTGMGYTSSASASPELFRLEITPSTPSP